MAFRVGQKVVRVPFDGDRSNEWAARGANIPEFWRVYTVRAIRDKTLLLYEIDNSHLTQVHGWGMEAGFRFQAFRPLVERKTELPACITALLDPKNHPPVPVEKEKAMSPGDQD